VTPHPSSDEFVRLWYRAVAATFLGEYRLGNGSLHLDRAREVLPRDPLLLFYAGAMHEAAASSRFQSVPATAPSMATELNLPPRDDELRMAERLLREAVKQGAPPEAQLRLGRIVGRLGKHAEAKDLIERTVVPGDDARLAYFRDLFLGTEEGALGRIEEARVCLERAARRFPTAQAPLIAMSDVFRRFGDRTAALDALRRLHALPPDTSARTDPWRDYHRSYAADAEDQLATVRAWVDTQGAR
jgi:tetratricopeptide (TPR) repeat protein